MRCSKKHLDTQHKSLKSKKKKVDQSVAGVDQPIRSNPNEKEWQLEQKYLKKRHKDQIR